MTKGRLTDREGLKRWKTETTRETKIINTAANREQMRNRNIQKYIIKLDGKKYSKSYNKARWNGRKVGRYSGIKD